MKTAVYRYRDKDFCNLQVKTPTKGFHILISEFDRNTKLLTFHVNLDEVDWQKTEDSIMFDLGQGKTLEIPVKKIRLD